MKLFILKDTYKDVRLPVACFLAQSREEALHRLKAVEDPCDGVVIADRQLIKHLLIQFVRHRGAFEIGLSGWDYYSGPAIGDLEREEDVEDFFQRHFFYQEQPSFEEREASEEGQSAFPWLIPPPPEFRPWRELVLEEFPITPFPS